MKTSTEIRKKRDALPPGWWFWRLHNGNLQLFRKHPVLGGWRVILRARRLGMDGATMDVVEPAAAPEDPLDPWESGTMVRVTRETHVHDMLVMDWIAESPEHVDALLAENDALRARLSRAIELLHMLDRADARHPDVAAFLQEGEQ